jgi:WD40 repeat protein
MTRPIMIVAGLACFLSAVPAAFAEKEKELFKTKATMAYFTPDGQFLVAAGNKNVRIIDLAAKKVHEIVKSYQPIVLAPDGKTLAVEEFSAPIDGQRTITLYDLPSGKDKGDPFQIPDKALAVDALTPDGKTFIHGELDDLIVVDTADGKIKHTFKDLGGQPWAVLVSPDGKYLACGTDSDGKKVWLWDLATLKPVRTFTGLPGFVQHVAFSADSKLLAATSDDMIKVWNVEDGKPILSQKGTKDKDKIVRGMGIGADGKILVTSCSDGLVTVWDLPSGKALDSFKTAKEPMGLSLSTDGKMLAVTMDGDLTAVYDLSTIIEK